MSTIFISHSSRDNQAARDMQVWLQGKGHDGVFLDFDPALGIPVGVDWEQELYQRLRACRAVIALVSPAWLASPWCFFELRQARFLGKAVFPLRIAPCDSGPILSDIQEGDLVSDPEAGHVQLWEGLQRAGLDPATMLHYDPARSPYPGLQALQEADAAIFFGRDDDINAALDTLSSLQRVGGARLLLLLGASGSGKSSLLRAGLLPRLRRDRDAWLVIEPFRPGEKPLDELAMALVATGERLALEAEPAAVRELVKSADPTGLVELLAELRAAAGSREGAALLLIDQAEELLGSTAEANAFLTLLRGILDAGGGRVMAVATLRSDLLGSLQNHKLLEDFAYATRTIDPLPQRRLPEIIEGPAEVAGLTIGPGLVSEMVTDAATADALPLLAFSLNEMHRRSRGGVLDLDLYSSLGGLEGSVRRAADGALQTLDPGPEALATLRDTFVGALVRSDDDGKIVRRRAFRDELPGTALPLLQHFVDARLLVAGRDASGRETLEVAHEALLRTWPRLRAWLEEDHDRLRQREVFRRAATVWHEQGRSADWLDHRGARLEAVDQLVEAPRFALASGPETDYLAACREREQQERGRAAAEAAAERRRLEAEAAAASAGEAAARRVASRTRIAAAITLVLAIAASGAGFVAYQNAVEADQQRQVAETALTARERADSRRLALTARQAAAAGNAELGLRIALAALPHAVNRGSGSPDTEQAADALALAVLRRHQMTVPAVHQDAIHTAMFAADGASILTASFDHTAQLWNLDRPAESIVVLDHEDRVWSAVFSPDGSSIATASADGAIRLWDAKGAELKVLRGDDGSVLSISFAPDGKTLLSTSEDGKARLWHPATDDYRALAQDNDPDVWWAGFSPDGEQLLTLLDGKFASLWDRSGKPIGEFAGLGDWLTTAAFSPDGRRIAIAGEGTVDVLAADSGDPVSTIRNDQGFISAVAFSPDGTWLATAGNDGTARVYDVTSGAEVLLFDEARGKPLWTVAFAPDGTSLLSAGDDGVARLYKVRRFTTFDELLTFATSLDLEPLRPEERAALFLAEGSVASADQQAQRSEMP